MFLKVSNDAAPEYSVTHSAYSKGMDDKHLGKRCCK